MFMRVRTADEIRALCAERGLRCRRTDTPSDPHNDPVLQIDAGPNTQIVSYRPSRGFFWGDLGDIGGYFDSRNPHQEELPWMQALRRFFHVYQPVAAVVFSPAFESVLERTEGRLKNGQSRSTALSWAIGRGYMLHEIEKGLQIRAAERAGQQQLPGLG